MQRGSLMMCGPLQADSTILTEECPACKEKFLEGDIFTLITLGPGPDPVSRERAREGRSYTAVAIPVHYACATGITNDEEDQR